MARRAISLLLIAAVCVLAVRAFFLRGLIRPIRVVSGSMVPALPGPHYAICCQDCRFTFACGLEYLAADRLVVCPNCGMRQELLELPPTRKGERVLVDRWPLSNDLPQRWQLVALPKPGADSQSQWAVKRVVGLPGEQVAIRGGDIYIDGQILRKSLMEQRKLRLLVYDDAHRPSRSRGLPARWQPEDPQSGWRSRSVGYVFDEPEARVGDPSRINMPLDWLTYRNWRCFAHPAPRTAEVPVMDHYAYNQSLSRELLEVADLMLSAQVKLHRAACQLGLRITDGREPFEVRLIPARQKFYLLRDSTVVREGALDLPSGSAPLHLELSLCDRQVLMAIDGEPLFNYRYGRSKKPFQPTSSPISIGARGMTLGLAELKIFRDIYYLDPYGTSGSWECPSPLDADQFFVLGDNVPVSEDSRHWPTKPVSRSELLGIVR